MQFANLKTEENFLRYVLFAQQKCFFSCFGDAGGQIDDIYLDNNLNDYLLLDLRCLAAGNDLLLFLVSCPARRRPAWQLLAGAGQVKEVSQRIDQCSCYLLHISMFLCIIILLMHYVFFVPIRWVLLFFVPVVYSSFKRSVQHRALLHTSHIAVK